MSASTLGFRGPVGLYCPRGGSCLVVDLDTLVRAKRAAGRPKDLEVLAELAAITQAHEEICAELAPFPTQAQRIASGEEADPASATCAPTTAVLRVRRRGGVWWSVRHPGE